AGAGQLAAVVPARVAAGAGGDPPFAPLGLAEIAADRARESDRRRRLRHRTAPPPQALRTRTPIVVSKRRPGAATPAERRRRHREIRRPARNSSETPRNAHSTCRY